MHGSKRLVVWPWAVIVAGAAMPLTALHAQALPPPALAYSIEGGRWPAPDSGARIQVTPKEAEVYVDGRLVGHVSEFSGFTQRLEVRPGGHELVVYLDGYRTIHEKLYFQPGTAYKIKGSMDKLPAGEATGPRPEAPPPAPRRPLPPRHVADEPSFGTLAIRVQPPEATVLIDGKAWEGPEGPRRLAVQLAEGTHRVDVQKDGFETFSTRVRVRGGEVTSLNVSLPPSEEQ